MNFINGKRKVSGFKQKKNSKTGVYKNNMRKLNYSQINLI